MNNFKENLRDFVVWIVHEIGKIEEGQQIDKLLIHQKLIDFGIIENLDPVGLMWATTKKTDDFFK